jgi:hypothetical protein
MSTHSLTSALGGVDSQRHSPAALPKGNRPGANFIGGWTDPGTRTDGRRKLRLRRDLIPEPSSRYQAAIPTALSRPTVREITNENIL